MRVRLRIGIEDQVGLRLRLPALLGERLMQQMIEDLAIGSVFSR